MLDVRSVIEYLWNDVGVPILSFCRTCRTEHYESTSSSFQFCFRILEACIVAIMEHDWVAADRQETLACFGVEAWAAVALNPKHTETLRRSDPRCIRHTSSVLATHICWDISILDRRHRRVEAIVGHSHTVGGSKRFRVRVWGGASTSYIHMYIYIYIYIYVYVYIGRQAALLMCKVMSCSNLTSSSAGSARSCLGIVYLQTMNHKRIRLVVILIKFRKL